ncbi:glutamate--tRNA ligase [Campylobacter geochelonis]|uniref:glutamate--tRNA ligase n=1 Tax=Campylobacter geochelonis TaxID=1780362 RepID=UPI000770A2A5|nr:glutamate--tRNA ligase [Campylobacter geochelonis]CZE49404.1 glutamylglutaminyl-tRNA synthetase [Campylobacter geochelonis]
MYRFAPSPTGDMHIGNLRAAIFNYICAKKDKCGFILRIEDTDVARNIEGKDDEIKEILTKFGISWDQFYRQSKNLKFHQEFANKLLIEKKAFCCFCTEEELEAKKELAKANGEAYRYDGTCERLSDMEVLECEKPFVVRMKKPNAAVGFSDAIKGELVFEPENIDSFVVMRVDKTPTYNFACAIDDMLEGVTFIIRGEDHVSNTPKQEWIRQSLGYTEKMGYAHLPIILNHEGKKMSKRENSSSVKWLLFSGYLPEAIANYLILLGNKTPCEIFTINDAIEWFDIKNISKSPAKFDIDKLSQINREHIRRASDERLAEVFGMDKKFANLIRFYTQEASLVVEISEKIAQIYGKKDIPDEFKESAEVLKKAILDMGIPVNFDEFKANLMQISGLKGKNFFMPLRVLLTNQTHGPELKELYTFIKDDIKEIVNV